MTTWPPLNLLPHRNFVSPFEFILFQKNIFFSSCTEGSSIEDVSFDCFRGRIVLRESMLLPVHATAEIVGENSGTT